MCIAFLLIYTAVFIPYRIAFEDVTPLGWLVTDILVDCIFLSDIVLNFLTGYREKQSAHLISDCRSIAMNYIKSWFFIDLISIFPF